MDRLSWIASAALLAGDERPTTVVDVTAVFDDRRSETNVILPSGRSLTLLGNWAVRDKLWPDAAIVFRTDRGIEVLEGGAHSSRTIYRWPSHVWRPYGPLNWSSDGTQLYAWLDVTTQLASFDVRNGDRKTLLRLPTYTCDLELRSDCDPNLVRWPRTIAEDGEHLLVLVQELSNDQVTTWRQRDDRIGGHQLLSLSKTGTHKLQLSSGRQWLGTATAWEFASARREVYFIVHEERTGASRLCVRSLDGRIVERFGHILGGRYHRIALSPDQRWLLLTRDVIPEPAASVPVVRNVSATQLGDVLAASRKGFVLINLDNGSALEIADGGYACSWMPDSSAISYLLDWELWQFNLADRRQTRIAWRQPCRSGSEPNYFQSPVWSADGTRVIVDPGGNDDSLLGGEEDVQTLVLDFNRLELLVLKPHASEPTWSLVPHPFKKPL